MTTLTIGTRLVADPSHLLSVDGDTLNQRAASHLAYTTPDGGWITHLGAWMRSAAADPDAHVIFGVWLRDADGEPSTLLARTAAILLPTTAADVGGPIAWTNPAYTFQTPTALRLDPSQRVMLGWLVYGGDAEVGTVFGATGLQYLQTVATEMVTNPFLGSVVVGAELPAVYATLQTGTRPNPPTLTSPAADSTTIDVTPTLVGTFADSDTALFGDGLRQYQIELREFGTTTAIWSGASAAFVASPAETLAGAFTREYSGPELINGHSYEWRASVTDAVFDVSDFSAWQRFDLAVGLFVDTSTASPTGKVDGNSAVITWSARWWQALAHNADRLQVRVWDGATLIRTGPEVSQTVIGTAVLPGTPFTISAVNAGIGALTPGRAYTFQIRARDAVTLEYSAWSARVPFRTNALPTIPAPTYPASGAVSANRPEVRFISFDPDDDDVEGTGVVWEIEFTEVATGTVRTASATAFDPATNEVSYQPTATDLPSAGAYTWRARGLDLSAGDFGISEWSASRGFTYTAGPSFTLIEPTQNQVLSALASEVRWTAPSQTTYRVRLYTTAGALFKDSGVLTGSATSFIMPTTWMVNGGVYDVQVESWVGATLSLSSLVRVSVNLTAVPAPTGVQAARTELVSQSVRVSWDPTTLPTGQFSAWVVQRWPTVLGQAAATTIATLTSPAQLFFDDTSAPSDFSLSYGVKQRRLTVTGTADSAVTVAPAPVSVVLISPVIVAIGDASLVFPVVWLGDGLSGSFAPRRSTWQTWGAQGKSFVVTAPGGAESLSVTVTLRSDDRGPMMQHFTNLKNIVKSGRPVTYRGEHSSEVFTMGIVSFQWRRGAEIGTREATLQLEEIAS